MTFPEWRAKLAPSRWLMLYGVLLHITVALSLLLISETWLTSLLIMMGLVALFIWFYAHWLARASTYHVVELARLSSGQWQIHYGDGRQDVALTLERSVVTQYVVVLYFRSPKKASISVWVWPDQLSRAQFHLLSLYCLDERLYLE